MGASVQFYGIESVMQAAINRDCPCWGIWVNGGLFSKCESSEMQHSMQLLQRNLELLQESNANAVYTLKFFECTDNKPVKINDKSITDGGRFNFKLIDEDERSQGLQRVHGYGGIIMQMRQEIADLKKELEEKDDEPDEEPETIGSVIIDLLKKPSELAQLVNIFRAAAGHPIQNLGMIAGVQPAAAAAAVNEDERLQRTANALDALEKSDPALMEHLEHLATMSKDNPDNFKMLLNMLGK